MNQRLNLLIAYAPADEEMKNEMEKHLSKLRKSKKANVWSNTRITVAHKWDEIAKAKLREADIILLLISQDFLSNSVIWKDEVNTILERYSYGTALVIPIILGNFISSPMPILNLQPLPRDGQPITSFTDKEVIYTEIFNDIEQQITVFSKKQKWLRLIDEETKKLTGKLDLRECELESIPEEIQKMEWLTELNLFHNQITTIQGLDKLTALSSLDLSYNQITIIQGLDKLTGLNRLYLQCNQIAIIQGMDKLAALNVLYLHVNQITTIQGLNKLTALNTLFLSSNQITTIKGLEDLTALTTLELSSNQITTIQGLDNFTKLKMLALSSNRITTIQGLDKLTALNGLFLHSNQIIIIQGLDNLTLLDTLFLSSNQITTIQGLDKLTALDRLDLSSNQITIIQGLKAFPVSIGNLCLFDNPIENISKTVFGTLAGYNCINDLKNFFAENIEINVPEVKLILTGNSDVGKTKFRTYLTTGVYDTTRNSTHGLEVYQYELEDSIKEQYHFDKDTKIYIWDFGGQEYFHNTHQLFFNQHAVYIFLWERETNKNKPIQTEVKRDEKGNSIFRVLEHFDVDYWLSNIRHFAQDAAIILVQNKVDDYEKSNKPLEWLSHNIITKYTCNNQYHISIIKTASKDLAYWYDFEKLKFVIFRELQTFISKNKEGKIYNQVRKEIERLQSANYWKVEDFILFIESWKSNSASVNAASIDNRLVIEHFSRQGKVLYPINQALENGKVIFTNPQWLSQKIYEILNDEVLQRNGFFDEKDLAKLVTDKKFETEAILSQIIELMKQYNIVFYNPSRKQYIAPQYLPEVPTVHYSQVKKLLATPKLIIKIEGFLPKSVINNIIAKYAIKDDAANYYKYGVKTEESNNILLIEVKYPQKKIYVYTDAIDAIYLRDIFTDIVLEFGIVLNRDSNLSQTKIEDKIDPTIIYETQIISQTKDKLYISIDDKIFVDWVELWNTNRSPDKNKDNDYCIAEDGNMVLRRMFAPFYLTYNEVKNIRTSEQLKPSKLFISYSSKNTDFMRRFVTHLEPLKRNGTIELWYDRMIEPGTKWDDSIKEEMRKADMIVFLLSPDFIATNYIFEFEIPQAIKQMEIDNSRLFFIELQPCSWDKTVLARFQQTTDPIADNKGIIMIEQAMNDAKWKEVIKELEKKITRK